MIHEATTLNCKGKLLDLSRPLVMGILNITDDSFFPGSRMTTPEQALENAIVMQNEGASIIDIGGMSSRPGSLPISEEEELNRILPVIELITRQLPEAILSIDTYRSGVAKLAVEAGASIINDISAGRMDANMYKTVGQLKVPYILMHMKGSPADMQLKPVYENVVEEVLDFFIAELGKLREAAIRDVIIDPGFGFGKTVEHNYQLLKNLHVFKITGVPILTGISRKSMIYKVLNTTPELALNGTSALHMVALQQGARILRTHDVAEAVEVIALYTKMEYS